jgi:hypothetical protein
MVHSDNRSIIGPFFFDDDIVTGNSLPGILENYAFPQLNSLVLLDTVPIHFAHTVRDSWNVPLPGRWTGRAGPVAVHSQWVVCRATDGAYCEVFHTLCIIMMNNVLQTALSYLFVPKLHVPEVLVFSLVDPICLLLIMLSI